MDGALGRRKRRGMGAIIFPLCPAKNIFSPAVGGGGGQGRKAGCGGGGLIGMRKFCFKTSSSL